MKDFQSHYEEDETLIDSIYGATFDADEEPQDNEDDESAYDYRYSVDDSDL